jgi:hypothetical protein
VVQEVDRQDRRPDDAHRAREPRLQGEGEENRGAAVLLTESEVNEIGPGQPGAHQQPADKQRDEQLRPERARAEDEPFPQVDLAGGEDHAEDGRGDEEGQGDRRFEARAEAAQSYEQSLLSKAARGVPASERRSCSSRS